MKDETHICYNKLSENKKNEKVKNWKNYEIYTRIIKQKLLQIP